MTAAPFVELRFNPTDLRPRDLPTAGAFLGSPADALEAALAVARASVVDQMKTDLRGLPEPSVSQMTHLADLAWRAAFWRFRVVASPVIAEAYLRAYRKADAGDVPMQVIYALADKHVEKIGDYFHETSSDALAEGFSRYVNRQLPAKAAADRVLDAYGLTPRQMRAYTSAKQFQTPVDSPMPRSLKARARAYIDRSFTTRTRKLSRQEEHNIDEQSKQFAWMWLQEKERLGPKAQKMWVTAHDERVCPVCGPLNGKKVAVGERFVTAQGEFWTPGLHPNCRCEVRLLENRFAKALTGADLKEFNQLHPRANDGRFGTKTRTRTLVGGARPQATALTRTHDPDLERKFQQIIAGGIAPISRATTGYLQARPLPAVAVLPQVAQPQVAPPIAMAPPQVAAPVAAPEAKIKGKVKAKVKAVARPDLKVKVIQEATKRPGQALDKPMFVVLQGADFENKRMKKITVEHGMDFTADREAADKAAAEDIKDLQKMEFNRVKREGAKISRVIPGVGLSEFRIPDAELRKIVQWHADEAIRRNMSHNPIVRRLQQDEPADEYYTGRWVEKENNEIIEPQKASYRWIGSRLGLDPDVFDIRVVEVEEGFMDQVEYLPDEAGGTAHLMGDFDVVPESIGATELTHNPVTRMKIRPARHRAGPDPTSSETVQRLRRLKGD